MNRRNFLGLLAPALILPELLVPKRTFFLPPKGGWWPEQLMLHARLGVSVGTPPYHFSLGPNAPVGWTINERGEIWGPGPPNHHFRATITASGAPKTMHLRYEEI
jgi:hypothetical protein